MTRRRGRGKRGGGEGEGEDKKRELREEHDVDPGVVSCTIVQIISLIEQTITSLRQ